MRKNTKNIGQIGENAACDYLIKKGYKIIAKNTTFRWAEIDIIAQKQKTIYFIEVKSRTLSLINKPDEMVSIQKISHLKRSIFLYLSQNNFSTYKLSFDIITVRLNQKYEVIDIRHFQNYPINLVYV